MIMGRKTAWELNLTPLPVLTSGSGCCSKALLCVKSRSASVYSQAVGKWQRAGTEPGEHVNREEEEEEDEGLSLDPREGAGNHVSGNNGASLPAFSSLMRPMRMEVAVDADACLDLRPGTEMHL